MNSVFQHSVDPVEIQPLDEHSENPPIEEAAKRADGIPGAGEPRPADEWTPTGDYYLG